MVTRLLLDGEIHLACSAFVSFSFASGPFMQPIYYTDQMQRSLDSFFSKKVAAQNLCRGHGTGRKITEKKYSFKHYARLPQGL